MGPQSTLPRRIEAPHSRRSAPGRIAPDKSPAAFILGARTGVRLSCVRLAPYCGSCHITPKILIRSAQVVSCFADGKPLMTDRFQITLYLASRDKAQEIVRRLEAQVQSMQAAVESAVESQAAGVSKTELALTVVLSFATSIAANLATPAIVDALTQIRKEIDELVDFVVIPPAQSIGSTGTPATHSARPGHTTEVQAAPGSIQPKGNVP